MKDNSGNMKIIIATHKRYEMPSDSIYLPLHVGKEGKASIGFTPDNTDDNISDKNSSFCELTGLYWAWKNLECDYLGLAHYRRHFTVKNLAHVKQYGRTTHDKISCVLREEELKNLVSMYDIIVPRKRNYYIETMYSHYSHTHYKEHLDVTHQIVLEKYPEYLKSFDKIMKSKSGYMFNMYIMKKELSDRYCSWLFDIMFELEKRIDMPELSQFQGRFYGRVSEIIFNVWLDYQVEQKGYLVKEIGCIHMDKINWFKKGTSFLKAKFFCEKYESSF